ncbi:MAG: HEAT repeat domain-containing protein [Pirellulaceae bacterium]
MNREPLGGFRRVVSTLAIATLWSATLLAQIPETAPLPPEEQQTKFRLLPGFEIQLVLADPDIGQPLNLNFDAQGRLWVTHTVEYPYPVEVDGLQPRPRNFPVVGKQPAKDKVTVVSGIGEDGKPHSITHFAEGLNIPIGVTPITDGNEALVFSIPDIHHFQDRDGNGHADQSSVRYGRFGNIDTHGLSNSYTRWIDGWIYGCHGFSNTSEITDGRGVKTRLVSGNTYRYKEDGSHFEQFSRGQVNPFGMTFDPLGNLYTADCHTMPITMVLRGALYPHFGNPPDALGFGPTMIDHLHGSTGICGPAYYAATHFPPDYQDNMFLCNPVTGRVHRDKLIERGSTYVCDTQKDFIRCDDPWFRPVDVMQGPDGALYVADFYNAVIGHYEAPLDHPRRDRTKGRVWRIVYKGEDGQHPSPQPMPNLTKLPLEELLPLLGHDNLLVRLLSNNWIVDAHAAKAVEAVTPLLDGDSAVVRTHALWIIERLTGLSDSQVASLAADPERIVRIHTIKALAERNEWRDSDTELAIKALTSDEDGFVRRAAADALARHPSPLAAVPLLTQWNETPKQDTHLIYNLRLTLREHMGNAETVEALAKSELADDLRRRLIEIAAVSDGPGAARLLLVHAPASAEDRLKLDDETLRKAITQIARHGDPANFDKLVSLAQGHTTGDIRRQLGAILSISEGLSARGEKPYEREDLRQWMDEIAGEQLAQSNTPSDHWTNYPVPGMPPSASPWGIRHRGSTDGNSEAQFFDSIVHGEQRTGILRSPQFDIPAQFSFWLCGHNGRPDTNPQPVNHVRLVLAETGEEIAREYVPRDDTAREIKWNLGRYEGKPAYVEVVDADAGGTYAWLAAGRFSHYQLEVQPLVDTGDQWTKLLRGIAQFKLTSHLPQLVKLSLDRSQPIALRQAALEATGSLAEGNQPAAHLAQLLGGGEHPEPLRRQAARVLGGIDHPEARAALLETLELAPATLQREIALALSTSKPGTVALVEKVEQGKASPRLLQDNDLAERLNRQADEKLTARVAKLLKDLPSQEARIQELIAQHVSTYATSPRSAEQGKQVFAKQCASCHKIGAEGTLVGPQLDGVGNRGLARLLEDILDPSRNVDAAFRTTLIATVDGRVLTGLERPQEGKTRHFADPQGKPFTLQEDEIEEAKLTNLSLMPANVTETLTEEQLLDLMAYLLSQATK